MNSRICDSCVGVTPRLGLSVTSAFAAAPIESEIERTSRPDQGLFVAQKRRFHKDEGAQSDLILAQKRGGSLKLVERHALVQLFQGLGMHRFQSHGHFQFWDPR